MGPIGDVGADLLFDQLHNLRMLAAVAARGSITGGARDLYRSPSVVTRGLAEVEKLLGLHLFERRNARFVPNWFGSVLLARIRRIEEEIAAATDELGRLKLAGSVSATSLRHLFYNGRKLLLLIHLADSRTASGAAATMAMTQSGVSMALTRLEEALGLRLFYRSLQGMIPTDAGARIVLRAKRIRAELRYALSELASVGGDPVGLVIIGALPLARSHILPRAISACLDEAPGVQVDAVEAPGETLIARLRSGEIDVVLTVPAGHFDPKGLVLEPLCLDELVVIASASHPLARAAGLSLGDVAGQRWVMPAPHSVSRVAFDRQLSALGLGELRPVVQTADLALIRQLLLDRSDMLALASRALVQHELRTGVIVALDLAMDPIERCVLMLQREGAVLSPAVAALIRHLRVQSKRSLRESSDDLQMPSEREELSPLAKGSLAQQPLGGFGSQGTDPISNPSQGARPR